MYNVQLFSTPKNLSLCHTTTPREEDFTEREREREVLYHLLTDPTKTVVLTAVCVYEGGNHRVAKRGKAREWD